MEEHVRSPSKQVGRAAPCASKKRHAPFALQWLGHGFDVIEHTCAVGCSDGLEEGLLEGIQVGLEEGWRVGCLDGCAVGAFTGCLEGWADGILDG